MDTLGMILGFVIIYVWLWPQSFGRWLGSVKTGYAKRLAEVVNALDKQIKDHPNG